MLTVNLLQLETRSYTDHLIPPGFDVTADITARHPETKVVVIALFDDQTSVVRALEAGASGHVSKQAEPDQIFGAVDAVTRGAQWLGSGVARPPIADNGSSEDGPLAVLTPREREIADLMSRGLTNPMIAERLYVSVKPVANYVSAVMLKLGAADRADAITIICSRRMT